MIPARGKALVRKVQTPETLPGGKVILTEMAREGLTAQQGELIALGEFPICEDGDCERPHVAVGGFYPGWPKGTRSPGMYYHANDLAEGNWVLLAPRSLVETDEPGLYVVRQDDVLAVLEA